MSLSDESAANATNGKHHLMLVRRVSQGKAPRPFIIDPTDGTVIQPGSGGVAALDEAIEKLPDRAYTDVLASY